MNNETTKPPSAPGEFLAFKRFLTPAFIQVLFWMGVACTTLNAIYWMWLGSESPMGGFWFVMMGLAMLVIGPLMWRVACEIAIVQFRIHDALLDIRDGHRGS